jgi:ATP-dependent RNA helicase DeaD
MTEFQGVIPALSQALTKKGYKVLTEVQNAVLAEELISSDLLVSAQTGSGKTVAFGLALAPTLLDGEEKFGKVKTPQALVIAPTRELALQVKRELEWLYADAGAKVVSCVGGMDMRTERNALKQGPHIVVGTPGRLKDHVERGYFDTTALKAVVLDEADEMLDMGFRDELEYILETTPKTRRTLLFSATVPKSILSMAKRYQTNAKRISTKEESKQHVDIDYQAIAAAPSDRENVIINLLRFHEAKNAIIFCGTRANVNHLTSRLTNRGFSVVALSGELSQAERSNALQALRDGRAQVCVATDVASRGIDLPGLALVIHADLPKNRDILLHRSGRTGRAGSKGVSALIVPYNQRSRGERLLQNAKVEANWCKAPAVEDILQRDKERFFTHPSLIEEIAEKEKASVEELVSRFSPEQVAAALLRIHSTKKPAPEELLDRAPPERKKENREFFKESVWVSLSVGHDDSANPRWLLPMICGAGHLTKGKIGDIRINQKDTHVQLIAECADGFFKAVGATGKIEDNITVTRLDKEPAKESSSFDRKKRSFSNDRPNRAPRSGGGGGSGDGSKRPFKKKPKGDFKEKSKDGSIPSKPSFAKEGGQKKNRPKKNY